MSIDDELEKSAVAAEIREESEKSIQSMLVRAGVVGATSLLDGLLDPVASLKFGVGAAIHEMLTQLAFRRTYQRMQEMFEQMNRRIDALGDGKIVPEWFRSEEFQTLLFEAFHQLRVTEDKSKIKMLGTALANSGATEFNDEDRKEMFLRLIRELMPQHIVLLRRLLPNHVRWQMRPQITAEGTDLLALQMLAANSLVEEGLETKEVRMPSVDITSSRSGAERALQDFFKQLQRPPLRHFKLSKLGRDFLKFVGAEGDVSGQSP